MANLLDCPGMTDFARVLCELGFRTHSNSILVSSQSACEYVAKLKVPELGLSHFSSAQLASFQLLCDKESLLDCWKAQKLAEKWSSEDQVNKYRNKKCALVNENSPLLAVIDRPGIVAKATGLCKSPKNEFKNFLACQVLAHLEQEAKAKELMLNPVVEQVKMVKREEKEEEKDVQGLLWDAEAALRDGNFDKAIQLGERSLAMEPTLETLEVLYAANTKNGLREKAQNIKIEIGKLTTFPDVFSRKGCTNYKYRPLKQVPGSVTTENESYFNKNKWIVVKKGIDINGSDRFYIGNADGTLEFKNLPKGNHEMRYIDQISCDKGIIAWVEGIGDCNGYREAFATSVWDGSRLTIENPVFSSNMDFLIGLESMSAESKLTLYDSEISTQKKIAKWFGLTRLGLEKIMIVQVMTFAMKLVEELPLKIIWSLFGILQLKKQKYAQSTLNP